MAATTLQRLQDWYASACDGDWERGFGISMTTLDDPGWSLIVHLEGIILASRSFEEYRENFGDDTTWSLCRKSEHRFEAFGGPARLEAKIETYLKWTTPEEERHV